MRMCFRISSKAFVGEMGRSARKKRKLLMCAGSSDMSDYVVIGRKGD